MAGSLFSPSLITSLLGNSGINTLAGRLGASEQATQKGIESMTSTLFGGLLSKARDTAVMQQTIDLASGTPADLVNHPASVLDGSNSTLLSTGSRFLALLFGSDESRIADVLGSVSGLKPGNVMTLFTAAAPLLLGILGKRVREGGLTANGLSSSLESEAPAIQRALPAGVGALLGVPSVGTAEAINERANRNPVVAQTVVQEKKPSNVWLWLLPLALIVSALLWYFLQRRAVPPTETESAAAVQQAPPPAATTPPVVPAAAPAPPPSTTTTSTSAPATSTASAPPSANLGNIVKQRLPDSIELNIPANGTESKLLAFIQDPNRKPDTTSWIDFDHLLFDTGATTLQAASHEQLQNVTEILKAYPSVHVKIGGYTDATGDPQQNLKLSQGRADSVVAQLVQMGIDASRLQAKGYGEQYPNGDNSTEDGRAKNRRISILVTQK